MLIFNRMMKKNSKGELPSIQRSMCFAASSEERCLNAFDVLIKSFQITAWYATITVALVGH